MLRNSRFIKTICHQIDVRCYLGKTSALIFLMRNTSDIQAQGKVSALKTIQSQVAIKQQRYSTNKDFAYNLLL